MATKQRKELQIKQKLSESGTSPRYGVLGISINGDYAIVADPAADGYEIITYVYHRQNNEWQLHQELRPADDSDSSNYFGSSASICGNFAILGRSAATDIDALPAAYAYELKDDLWEYTQKLQPSDVKTENLFGISVDLDGETAIVGSLSDTSSVDGAAYIYELEGGQWEQKIKLSAEEDDRFAHDVSIDNNVVIIGAPFANRSSDLGSYGAAYIHHFENGTWVQNNKLQPSDLESDSEFGYKVDVAGDWAIVGAIKSDISGYQDAGAAYIYHRQNNVWQLYQKIEASDPNEVDYFGYSVCIGEGVALVGSRSPMGDKIFCGAVYLFELVDGTWVQQQKLQPSDLLENDEWGISSSLDGNQAIIGGYGFAYICELVTIDES